MFRRLICTALCLVSAHLFAESASLEELKQELGLENFKQHEQSVACRLYVVHHGDTDWSIEDDRLQGWIDIPLNEKGKEQALELAERLSSIPVTAIYTSPLVRASETAEKIAQKHPKAAFFHDADLKGETHGLLEGKSKKEYSQDPHFRSYKALSAEQKIFFPVGKEGESKADVARRTIPALKEICRKHPNQDVIVVTHGGIFKFMNVLLGNYTKEGISEVAHGDLLIIEGDEKALWLPHH